MKTGFIYGLICPKTNNIRYVGQCYYSIIKRIKRHIKDVINKKGKLTKKESWIKSLIFDKTIKNLTYIIIEECKISKLDEREIYWISFYRSKFGKKIITNTTDGGQKNRILSGENHPNFGKHLSEKTKLKIGKANKGVNNGMFGKKYKMTKKTKEKISSQLKNSNVFRKSRKSIKYRNKISDIQSIGKTVLLINKTTNEIYGTYKNCKELSKYLECTYGNIKNARKNKTPIGKRIKKLNAEYYVILETDFINQKFLISDWVNKISR